MTGFNILFPINNPITKTKKLWGFDIETYGQKNKFLMCSIVGDDKIKETFWDKHEFIRYLKRKMEVFRHGYIVSTNLQFDLLGAFHETEINIGN